MDGRKGEREREREREREKEEGRDKNGIYVHGETYGQTSSHFHCHTPLLLALLCISMMYLIQPVIFLPALYYVLVRPCEGQPISTSRRHSVSKL